MIFIAGLVVLAGSGGLGLLRIFWGFLEFWVFWGLVLFWMGRKDMIGVVLEV